VKAAVQRGLVVCGAVFLVAIGAGIILGLTGEDGGGTTDAEMTRWVLDYQAQLDSWSAEVPRTEAAAKRGDFAELGRVVQRIGRDGDLVRRRFDSVPPDLEDGDRLYRLMVDAGDAASEWARIYRVDPPPYGQSRQGLRKAQDLSDAVVNFQQNVNAAARATVQG
jgi:hypothetical protein